MSPRTAMYSTYYSDDLVVIDASSSSSCSSVTSNITVNQQHKTKQPLERGISDLSIDSAATVRRSVSFASQEAHINEIPSHSEYSVAEKADTWYTKPELEGIKKDIHRLVRRLEAGKTVDPNESCIRGLEGRVIPAAQRKIRVNLKRQCIVSVLKEQERQWDNFECNPEEIAKISIRSSRQCQTVAFRKARGDFRESRKP